MSAGTDPSQSTEAEVERLRLKYGPKCSFCGAPLPVGAPAAHVPGSDAPRCGLCVHRTVVPMGSSGPTAPAAQIDPGTAGASARREYDRRAANREARVKERFGRRFGGLVLAVTDEPQSTRAWAKGAVGEAKLAAALDRVPGAVVLNDRKVPGTRGNIDHIVVAPAGVFVVDAKHYEGRLRIRDKGGLFHMDNRLYVGGRDCSKLADNMGWQVAAVEKLLVSAGDRIAVTPALCFIDVDWPLLFAPDSFRGVRLVGPKSLRKLITASPALDAAAIDKLARILATGFPAK